MNQTKIVMLGESLSRQGGIVSVEKLMLDNTPVDINLRHVPTLGNGSALQNLIYFIKAMLVLLQSLINKDSDLIHTHVSERGSAFRQAITTSVASLFGIPVILHAHGAEFHIFYNSLPTLLKKAIRLAFQQCSHFIVLSESWRNYYINDLGLREEKVSILPNPIKFPEIIPVRSGKLSITILFLGRICHRKGAYDIVNAFAELAQEDKSRSKLIIAGDGDVVELRKLVKKLCLSSYIDIFSWVDSKERDAFLARADIFVLPSYNEGLPMAILEAMSWGLPVITTPVGGIPELVVPGKNGLMNPPGDISKLKNNLQLLINNEALRIEIGRFARETVQDYDIQKYMLSLGYLYEKVLNKNKKSVILHRT